MTNHFVRVLSNLSFLNYFIKSTKIIENKASPFLIKQNKKNLRGS